MADSKIMEFLICKLHDYFNNRNGISAVYLFGSAVKGKSRQNSDIDLGVLFSPGMDSLQRFDNKLDMTTDLERLLKKEVDIVDLESAGLFFLHQLFLNKILIVEKDIQRRVEFEVKSRKRYFDMLPFYTLYHSQALKRLERRQYHG